MKYIKDMKLTTKEGITFKFIAHFPSHEWGDEGGTTAKVYYKGRHVANLYDDGNGGMADIYFKDNVVNRKTLNKACMDAIKRIDPSMLKYSWKWTDKYVANGDDYNMLCGILEDMYVKSVRKNKARPTKLSTI